jgi:hypothetical protein
LDLLFSAQTRGYFLELRTQKENTAATVMLQQRMEVRACRFSQIATADYIRTGARGRDNSRASLGQRKHRPTKTIRNYYDSNNNDDNDIALSGSSYVNETRLAADVVIDGVGAHKLIDSGSATLPPSSALPVLT